MNSDITSVRRRAHWTVAAFSLVYFAATWSVIRTRPLWTDEISTYFVARAPLAARMNAIRLGADITPPLFDMMLHPFAVVLGAEGIRLPAMLGVWAMALCLYLVVARLRSPVHGLVAMLLPFVTLAEAYSYEGRPYGLLLAASAAALLFRERLAAGESSRRWNLLGLAASLGLAGAIHYFGFLSAAPLAAAEAVRIWSRRRADWSLLACLAAPVVPLVHALPFARSAKPPGLVYWGLASAGSVRLTYVELLGPALWVLPVVAIAIAVACRCSTGHEVAMRELRLDTAVALAGFALLPYGCVVLGALAGGYSPRYALAAVVGLTAGAACLIPRRAAAAACVVIALFAAAGFGERVLRNRRMPRPAVPAAAIESGSLPIVYGGIHQFFAASFYSPAAVRPRLHYLTDPSLELAWTGQNASHYFARAAATVSDLGVADFHAFTSAHPKFILITMAADAHPWILAELRKEGAEARVRWAAGDETVFEIDLAQQWGGHPCPRRTPQSACLENKLVCGSRGYRAVFSATWSLNFGATKPSTK